MNDHERGFLTFVENPGRRRLETLLALGERRRADVRAMLDHDFVLRASSSKRLIGAASRPDAVEAELRARGAPAACYLISADARLDGREMPLNDALAAVIGRGNGAFVSCLPGRLGFYEYEDVQSSYLLSR